MRWAFEAYATGEWTIRRLLDELTARGLTTVPGARGPGKPLEVSHLHTLLRHPYYVGIVRYKSVVYSGRHDPLTTPEIWKEVQERLTNKHLTGEKERRYPHYLKGSIYCEQCGARLIVCHAKGRGGTYPYFICIGRQRDKTSCKQRAIRIEQAEEAVAAHYATVQLPEEEAARLRAYLDEELSKLAADSERERAIQERRLRKLAGERKKLLDAHYADAIPLDLLKSEQTRIAAEVAAIEGRQVAIDGDFAKAKANLERALTRAGDCEAAYREASDRLRRQFNLAFFKRLLLGDDGTVTGELAEPFDVILGEELRRAAVAQESEELRQAVEEALRGRADKAKAQSEQRPQGPERLPVGASTSAASMRGGFSPISLVQTTGVLSNHQNQASLVHLAKRLAGLRASGAQPRAVTSRRLRLRRPGWVLDAVVRVLADQAEPMRLTHVHVAVEKLLDQTVSKDSVGWCLSTGVRGKEPRFERVAYGRYRLLPQT
jgi:site-specific DNA recombinase